MGYYNCFWCGNTGGIVGTWGIAVCSLLFLQSTYFQKLPMTYNSANSYQLTSVSIHRMRCIIPSLLCTIGRFQIYDNRLLRIAHNHPLTWLIRRRIDLLVRRKGWYINKIPWL